MPRRGSRDLAVGAMFALGLVVLALAIMAVGGESGLFFKRTEFIIQFPSADGLLLGEDDGASDVLEKILVRFPEPPFDDVSLSSLMQIFRDFLPDTDVDAMYRYPKLVGERGVRKAQKDSRLACLPAAMMALVSNPRATRGVKFELADAELRESFSTPTRVLFSDGGDAV